MPNQDSTLKVESFPKICLIENTFYTILSLRMELIYFLKNNGYKIYLLSTGDSNDKRRLEQDGFECVEIGSVVSNPLSMFSYSFSIYKALKKINPKAVISFTVRPNIFGSIASNLVGIPIINNITGIGPLQEDKSMTYRLIRLLYKRALKTSHRVYFQNEDDFKYFLSKNFVNQTQSKVIPGSGVDTEKYIPKKKELNNGKFTFLMISRLIKDKGVLEYIQAAEILKKEFNDSVEFQLLGPLWAQNKGKNTIQKEEVEEWEKSGIINYLGYTYDVRPFIAESDCIVLPSYREGSSNVLMQGASMGKPLIASNVVGCNNIVTHNYNGLLCKPMDSLDLAQKMREIIQMSPEKREQMGENGRAFMQANFEKKNVLNIYLEELNSLVHSN